MIFKRLFLATLAALSLVACSDNDTDQVLSQVEPKGDVIVTFAAAGGVQLQTKAEATTGYQKKYNNFENTASVEPYCFKTVVNNPEFVIDHMTVLAFDESGKLVKTVSFKEAENPTVETGTKGSANGENPNSIYQFGGIVLKEGTYKFILMGNIGTVTPSSVGTTDFEKYQSAVVTSLHEGGYLPMVKMLENITLKAFKANTATATATLNVITGEKVTSPTNETDNMDIVPSGNAIELERLVARIDLASVKFDWKQPGAENMELQLTGVCLVNASKQSFLAADNGAGKGYWNGEFKDKDWYSTNDEMSMVAIGGDKQQDYVSNVISVSLKNQNQATTISGVSFYAFAKDGIEDQHNTNWKMQLVLQCLLGDKKVYYYAPLKDGTSDQPVSIVANHYYKMNVTVTGDGSDEPGKKKDTVDATVKLEVSDWNTVTQDENADPTPIS